MRRVSVRARATVMAAAVVALTLAAAALVLVATLDRSLTHSSDTLARARVDDLAGLAVNGTLPSALTHVGGDGIAQVVTDDGRVLAASANIRGAGPVSAFHSTGDEPVLRTITAPDDDETEIYRVWVRSVETNRGIVTIFVGDSAESLGEATGVLRGALLVGVPVVTALLAVAAWIVVGRALRPVEQIRSEVAAISAERLDRRVPVPATQDEVGRLAVTMNAMLDRLEAAGRQQRDFVADASHELQSPLASFRAQLEVSLAHRGSVDWVAVATELLDDSAAMERLVRDLLFLAAHESTPAHWTRTPVDLDDIVLQEADRCRLLGRVALDTTRVSAAPVQGDPDELRRLVRNLMDNAVRHARGEVRLALRGDGDAVRLDVCDDGPGIPAADRDRVFDRFYRADTARARGSGTGLGLAIARSIAEQHGGRLQLADACATVAPGTTDDGVTPTGAHFVLHLPSAPPIAVDQPSRSPASARATYQPPTASTGSTSTR